MKELAVGWECSILIRVVVTWMCTCKKVTKTYSRKCIPQLKRLHQNTIISDAQDCCQDKMETVRGKYLSSWLGWVSTVKDGYYDCLCCTHHYCYPFSGVTSDPEIGVFSSAYKAKKILLKLSPEPHLDCPWTTVCLIWYIQPCSVKDISHYNGFSNGHQVIKRAGCKKHTSVESEITARGSTWKRLIGTRPAAD